MSNLSPLKSRTILWLVIPASLLSGCATPKQNSQNVQFQPKPMQRSGPEITLAKTGDLPHDPSLPAPTATLESSLAKLPPEKTGHLWLQTGRYRTQHAVPTEAQKNLLEVIIQITLPDEVQSIRSAVSYLLANSGYEFALPTDNHAVAELLTKPIPAVHRHLGPMTLQSALETLAGDSFKLTIDPIHRRLSYKLLPVVQEGGQFL